MSRNIHCLRCDRPMTFLMRENFQRGDAGAWVGHLNLSFHGGFEMEVYSCSRCGKLEFFLPADSYDEQADLREETACPENGNIVYVNREGIPQVRCPACGKTHDFDYPKCPHCEYLYR